MGHRPDRLLSTARRVINASRVLTESEKRLWVDIHVLDGGPDGCISRPDTLARRLALSRDTVESVRRHLKALGLIENRPRHGTWGDSWYATMPEELAPPKYAKDPQVFELADQLDVYLEERPRRTPKRDLHVTKLVQEVAQQFTPESGGGSAANVDRSLAAAAPPELVEGGDGGAASSPHSGGDSAGCLAAHAPPPCSTDVGRTSVLEQTSPPENGVAHATGLRTDEGHPLEVGPSGRLRPSGQEVA